MLPWSHGWESPLGNFRNHLDEMANNALTVDAPGNILAQSFRRPFVFAMQFILSIRYIGRQVDAKSK